jgi:hypothetical protein
MRATMAARANIGMNTDERLRASDYDRDHVLNILRDTYVEGRITAEEFEERTGTAMSARTIGELRRLTADLPASAPEMPGTSRQAPASGLPFAPLGPAVIAVAVVAIILLSTVVPVTHVIGVPVGIVAFVLFRCVTRGTHRRGAFGERHHIPHR